MPGLEERRDVERVALDRDAREAVAEALERLRALVDDRDVPAARGEPHRDRRARPGRSRRPAASFPLPFDVSNMRPERSAGTGTRHLSSPPVTSEPLGIGLLGYGTVGSAVDRLLRERADVVERVAGRPVRVVRALVRDAAREREGAAPGPLHRLASRRSATTRRSRSWPRSWAASSRRSATCASCSSAASRSSRPTSSCSRATAPSCSRPPSAAAPSCATRPPPAPRSPSCACSRSRSRRPASTS